MTNTLTIAEVKIMRRERTKTVFQRIEQKNRLFAKFAGPGSHLTSERNKRRIFRVLFDRR